MSVYFSFWKPQKKMWYNVLGDALKQALAPKMWVHWDKRIEYMFDVHLMLIYTRDIFGRYINNCKSDLENFFQTSWGFNCNESNYILLRNMFWKSQQFILQNFKT